MKSRRGTRRAGGDPLPSWNDSPRRRTIEEFVARVSTPGQPDYVAPAARIAVFGGNGTLWCERPIPFELYFAMDRLEQLAAGESRPEVQQPFRAFLEKDARTIATFGKRETFEFAALTRSGMTEQELTESATSWLVCARHPALDRRFIECVYQPQLELLALLNAHDFRTFIVSGSSSEFLRAFSESVYGIPPERVIGTRVKTRLDLRNGDPVLLKVGGFRSFDDREEKVVNIDRHIGRRPIFAFGNSDGDLRMLQYTASGEGARLSVLVQHDDAQREFAYDRDFRLSPLDEALQQAHQRGWCLVSMKHDWRTVFAPCG